MCSCCLFVAWLRSVMQAGATGALAQRQPSPFCIDCFVGIVSATPRAAQEQHPRSSCCTGMHFPHRLSFLASFDVWCGCGCSNFEQTCDRCRECAKHCRCTFVELGLFLEYLFFLDVRVFDRQSDLIVVISLGAKQIVDYDFFY